MNNNIFISLYDINTLSLAPHMLAQALRGDVLEFSIFSDTVEDIVEQINRRCPDMVGFSVYVWNFSMVKEILPRIKATTIVGGPHVTDLEDEFDADIVVPGRVRLPLLDYSKIQLDKYSWVPFETSRGCPMRCGYCSWSGNKMRYHPLEWVYKQLDTILSSKIKKVYLCDSSLLFNKPRAKQILEYCRTYQKPIRFEFGIGQLDKELIDILISMPQSEFNFGIQSINPRALGIIGRTFSFKDFEREYEALKDHHNITLDVIYGLPGDNIAGYKKTLNYAASFSPKRILTNPLVLLPGSRFWQERHKYGIEYDRKTHLVISTNTFSKKDMQEARDYSFEIVKGRRVENAPDLVPTIKEGFERRNKWLAQ